MLVHKGRYFRTESVLAWWPQTVQEVTALLDQASVVVLWQCPVAMIPELRPWVFWRRPFQTPLIDLTRTEEELWQGLHRTSCRKEVRQAQEMDLTVAINQDQEMARWLINDSIRRLRYRTEVSESDWQALLPNHDVFLCRSQETPLAAHVLLGERPHRARPVLSGTADRHDERVRGKVGHANRLLHWREFLHYKAQGFHYYDFGGCNFDDKNSPEYAISLFKQSFGAEIVEEPMLYLAKSPALRALFHTHAAARNALRKLPWPDSWLQAVRANPKLASLIH